MAGKVQFELVTPSHIMMEGEVDMVVVPGAAGDFGVLPGHAPLLSTLRPGIVDVYENDTVSERVFVAGGFAEVAEDRFTVLAEEAVEASEIDREAAAQRLEQAREALARAETGDDEARRRAAETEIAVAEALLAAAG